MDQINNWLDCLPTELYDLIYEYVAHAKYEKVLQDLKWNTMCSNTAKKIEGVPYNFTLCNTLCDRIESISYTSNCLFDHLCVWYNYNLSLRLIDSDSLSRIKKSLEMSSPYIVYIEYLNYQELLNLHKFIKYGDYYEHENPYGHYDWWHYFYPEYISDNTEN